MNPQRDVAGLARRLRQLRKEHWPDQPLTQQNLADVFKVALSSISSWENPTSGKIPPPARLAAYATLFATRRSLQHGLHIIKESELTNEEKAERNRLFAELGQLRLAVPDGRPGSSINDRPRSLWHFPDNGPVRLICGRVSQPPPTADTQSHNYIHLSRYADLDALVELLGHLRYENPESDVHFDLAPLLQSDDLTAHLILFGSGAINQVTHRIADLVDLPVRQVGDPVIKDGEVFEVIGDELKRFRPKFANDDPQGVVIEDVGMFFRAPNPNNITRTLSICSGVFTRGVYGAVRLLTDVTMREENHSQLANMFGEAHTFGLLIRVPVFDHVTSTPDLRRPGIILYSWSAA